MVNKSIKDLSKFSLQIAKQIQNDVLLLTKSPDPGLLSQSEKIIPFSIVKGTRGYIEKIVKQINGCYEKGWFDGCAVMVRRLFETLIIESYEKHSIEQKIKDSNGNFFYLSALVNCVLSEPSWTLSRNTKKALPRLKTIGDLSAHSRRFIADRKDIDKFIDDIRIIVQEFVYLANLQ